MLWLAVLLITASFVALGYLMVRSRPKPDRLDPYPYNKNHSLFSPAERSFLGVLDQAISYKFRIFCKMRVADVVSVKELSDRGSWQRAFNRIIARLRSLLKR